MPDLPTPSAFASRLAAIAKGQFDQFGLLKENQEPLLSQLRLYWAAVPRKFPGAGTAWSGAFICYCVRAAGATSAEFKFAGKHSVFVHHSINHPDVPGAFRGLPVALASVRVGDILQVNRNNNRFDFEFARANSDYLSHSSIVVARGSDANGKFILTVGGNESDSVRQTRFALKDDGTIKQPPKDPFIALLRNQK